MEYREKKKRRVIKKLLKVLNTTLTCNVCGTKLNMRTKRIDHIEDSLKENKHGESLINEIDKLQDDKIKNNFQFLCVGCNTFKGLLFSQIMTNKAISKKERKKLIDIYEHDAKGRLNNKYFKMLKYNNII